MYITKACKNCRWCSAPSMDGKRLCFHRMATIKNYKTSDWYEGKMHVSHLPISVMRGTGACGAIGRLFEEIKNGRNKSV